MKEAERFLQKMFSSSSANEAFLSHNLDHSSAARLDAQRLQDKKDAARPGATSSAWTPWSWFWTPLNRSFQSPSFPLVWVLQKVFGLLPINWLTLTEGSLAAEVEDRKKRARDLSKFHQYFLHLLFVWVILEMLRYPVLWLTKNYVDYEITLFSYVSASTLFYIVYGAVLLTLAGVLVEIFRSSSVARLDTTLTVLRQYHADYLLNSNMFAIARVEQEDPRDKFAHSFRNRHLARQEAERQTEFDEPWNVSQNSEESQSYRSPYQRQLSGSYRRSSPHRNWNDSLNRSFTGGIANRTFGSSPSSASRSSTTSPPSCLVGAKDWDPVDRQEIDEICGSGALNRLLAQEEQFGKQRLSMLEDDSMNWSPQMQSLRDQNYQTSGLFRIPSPKKSKKSADRENIPERLSRLRSDEKIYPTEDFSWVQLKVSVEVLHLLTENVRMWLADTVISPLLIRIDEVNVRIREKVHMENVVGESAPDQLRLIAQQYRLEIPELLQVIPFLDISMQQDYVVQRLRDLVKDGVLGDYSWNSGASYGGQPWQDFLPTDAALLMHCFITFLDVMLPPDPHASNWRNFSHRYVLRSISSWRSEDPNKPMIHQAVSNPPKYEILYSGQFLQVSEGKNNVFHTILLFVRLLQLREKNDQGYANLGPGRIIFRIFDKYL